MAVDEALVNVFSSLPANESVDRDFTSLGSEEAAEVDLSSLLVGDDVTVLSFVELCELERPLSLSGRVIDGEVVSVMSSLLVEVTVDVLSLSKGADGEVDVTLWSFEGGED